MIYNDRWLYILKIKNTCDKLYERCLKADLKVELFDCLFLELKYMGIALTTKL